MPNVELRMIEYGILVFAIRNSAFYYFILRSLLQFKRFEILFDVRLLNFFFVES
jgi:hypothetical protein